MSQIKEDLEQVAASLELGWAQTGWVEGRKEIDPDLAIKYGDSNGYIHGCLLMHMRQAGAGSHRMSQLREALGFKDFNEMYCWNDLPTTTWDDVKNRVREAIEKL